MISPSSLPSKIISLSNFKVPVSSTSLVRMFLDVEGSDTREVMLLRFMLAAGYTLFRVAVNAVAWKKNAADRTARARSCLLTHAAPKR
jgi:hypothetical protein